MFQAEGTAESEAQRKDSDLREADGARVWKGGRGGTGRGMARTSKVSGPLIRHQGASKGAWRVPGTEEPGRLQSMGSQRVGHD